MTLWIMHEDYMVMFCGSRRLRFFEHSMAVSGQFGPKNVTREKLWGILY